MGNTKAIAKRNEAMAKTLEMAPVDADDCPSPSLTPGKACKVRQALR